jgi:alkanesulfonate monooxygenase SsuD/methylene tetrahydromethanopterin reductase-like flavin-dependent oxidoreductase (luciferase family)
LPAPVADFDTRLDRYARAILDDALARAIVGGPDTVQRGLDEFIRQTGADELIVTANIFDTPSGNDRSRSWPKCMAR